ncbi:MAG: bifunctional methylenetetrahydrofolate dehydrogenase/methenyltetrahydrofolate cyclohydrolase FolD [Candidatus Aminicenantes bacterium]|nr:bifunctional methylenetetrahydrofolate dehydrogenase/methenyltetrahydrofolate cyclohydrolase FolD [Candidatus Aminicenantes bacterium]MBL7082207.1 bifunctional methylenetetrahydrofolate dehydrogenase/methenyltetrahydrofolate cyclohydrolase FolD [Candidatus Aminicenantes bacterium]
MGSWLEGKTLANKIKEEVKDEVASYLKTIGQVPGLVGIRVGEDRASKVYLRTKERACEKLGIHSEILNFPEDISVSLLKSKIEQLSSREDVDGILIQLPLPSSFDSHEIITSMPPEKDVDGFHPFNLGNLLLKKDGVKPCTPLGIIELLKFRDISIEGKRVVIIGRSIMVGKPLAAMMTNENGTVTTCHTRTKNLPQVASEADILVAAIGRGTFITPEFVKPGAVVIDVGIDSLSDKSKVEELFGKDKKRQEDLEKKGYTIIGDVHPQVIEKAEYLTPVPGGVGLLTVAMLMKNTLEAFKRRRDL